MDPSPHEPIEARASVRVESIELVLDAILAVGPDRQASRDELGARTGLARATVSRTLAYLKALNRAAIMRGDEPVLIFDERVGRTRRAEYVRLNPSCGLLAAADASHKRLTVAIGDPWGRIQSKDDWETTKWSVDSDPYGSLDQIASMLRRLIERRGVHMLLGVGIAIAAPVSPRTGIVRSLTGTIDRARGSWVGIDVADELRRRLSGWDVPIVPASNDADVAAANEFRWASERWTSASRLRDMLYVKWSSGVGGAVIIGGRLHKGAAGFAGEMHSPVPGLPSNDLPIMLCERCGRRNCLENVASYEAMKRRLNLENLSRVEFEWNPLGKQEIERVAVFIGRTLGPLVNVLAPQALVIGGPSPTLHSSIVAGIREGLAETAIPPLAAELQVRVAEPRWVAAGDTVGRLAVVSAAMADASNQLAVAELHSKLIRARAAVHSVSAAQAQAQV